jgi:hypothetical protein
MLAAAIADRIRRPYIPTPGGVGFTACSTKYSFLLSFFLIIMKITIAKPFYNIHASEKVSLHRP